MKTKILLVAGLCISTSTLAGGYRVALQGQAATGMGHTGVAVTESAEVIFFNPASMSLLKSDTNFSIGSSLINSTIKYQNAATNTAAETDNPTGTPLYLYYSKKFNDKISYGVGVYTPYGNTVDWEKDWAGSHLVNNISLKTVFVQPTISYKINNMLSVGLGPTYVNGSVELTRNLTSSTVDGNGDRSNVTVKATGISAWGYNLGLVAKPAQNITVGFNYRSKVDMKARDEDADFENVPSSLSTTFFDTTFDADLVLPAELTLGASFQLSPKTIIALDINRVFWGAFESLDVTFANGEQSLGPRNYEDANVYRIGVQHQLNNNLIVRTGAYYDNSPISDGYYTPETARNDSIGLTAGASFKLSKRLDLDFSFLYLIFKEFNGSYDFVGHDDDPLTTDTSFGGDYISTVTTFGFGLNYKY